jgi:3-hydroxybutyryl-CoA dehydrogenase
MSQGATQQPAEVAPSHGVRRVTVIGAGTMGHGIAGQAALCGFEVRLFDPSDAALEGGLAKIAESYAKGVERGKLSAEAREGALSRLSAARGGAGSASAGADLVIEAIPERLELKRALLSEVAPAVSARALLASNTSSLSISALAEGVAHPERVIGMHFFNPVAIMPLLELVRGERTSDEVVARARALGEALQKTCIVVKDSPGFATSRLGIALGNEAMRMFEEGVASAEDIDRAMVLGYKHPIGPLALTDLVGLDVRLSISEHLHRELGADTFQPPQVLRDKVARGELGKKVGRGFYTY